MRVYEKVKIIREDRKLSQEYIAHKLGLSQSQYSRRECGSIKFIPEELRKLCKILEIPISQLFDKEKDPFSIQTQKNEHFEQHIVFLEKRIKQYESRIQEKAEVILLLREKINLLETKL